jgi:hypothetical protein
MARDLAYLIEATLILTSPVQRNGDDAVDLVEEFFSTLPHPLGKWTRQRNAVRIFQRVNDLSQRAFVFANRPCARDGR